MTNLYPSYNRTPISFTHGEGPWLYSSNGKRYFDFGSGIAVNAFGHGHARLARVIGEQAGKLMHVSNLYQINEQEALASALCELSFADRVFFTNSGAEAIECAIKTARKYHFEKNTGKKTILSFQGAFHGRTYAGISAVGSEAMTKGFFPILSDFQSIALSMEAIEAHIDNQTAAVIIEPVIGEGGIIPVPIEILQFLRARTQELGALLIFDEIQCGMGRTGKLFAHDYAEIAPDIMALAKGIGAGFPLGACLASEEVAQYMSAGTHGSTYGGNPLACRVGLEVLSMIADENILDNVQSQAQELQNGLDKLIADFPEIFLSWRGKGLMLGIECAIPNMEFIQKGRDMGVLTVPASGNIVRILPPLNIGKLDIHEGLALLRQVATALNNK